MYKSTILILIVFVLTSCFNDSNIYINDNIKDNNDNINDNIKIKDNDINDISKQGTNVVVSLSLNDYNVIEQFDGSDEYCTDNDSYICKLIYDNYFDIKYNNKCLSLNNIDQCDFLVGNEKRFCKGDLYFKQLIATKDKNICNNFEENFYHGEIMGSEKYNNNELCNKFYTDLVSKNDLTEADILKFTNDVSIDPLLYGQLKAILLNDVEINDVGTLFEVKMRKGELECNKLDDIKYLFGILKELKSF